jgi:hypothetical protein
MNEFTSADLTNPVVLAVFTQLLFLGASKVYREILRDNALLMERWYDLFGIVSLLVIAIILAILGQASISPLTSVAVGDALLRAVSVWGFLASGYKLIKSGIEIVRTS